MATKLDAIARKYRGWTWETFVRAGDIKDVAAVAKAVDDYAKPKEGGR